MQNAQMTKGKVDAELKDLEKTLKNIEEARPFEDLTVVCCGRSKGGRLVADRVNADSETRTRLLLHAQILMRRLRNSYRRDAGVFQATRCVIP